MSQKRREIGPCQGCPSEGDGSDAARARSPLRRLFPTRQDVTSYGAESQGVGRKGRCEWKRGARWIWAFVPAKDRSAGPRSAGRRKLSIRSGAMVMRSKGSSQTNSWTLPPRSRAPPCLGPKGLRPQKFGARFIFLIELKAARRGAGLMGYRHKA